jgi:small subunit ribosomal protein S2
MIPSMMKMLEAGVHFGHQTARWNPKMKPYIFGARNGIYIINLDDTVKLFRKAYDFVVQTAAGGGDVLFVGTKLAAQEEIKLQAVRCGMPFVNNRWPGGMMTNFSTVKTSIDKLRELDARFERADWGNYTKKEVLMFQRSRDKLERSFSGVKEITRVPDAMFIVDTMKEHLALKEAVKLGIPIVAMVDTNCDPDCVDYVIPGNDDAMRSIALFSNAMADAVMEGRQLFEERVRSEDKAGGKTFSQISKTVKPVEVLVAVEPVEGVEVKVRPSQKEGDEKAEETDEASIAENSQPEAAAEAVSEAVAEPTGDKE